MSFQSPHGPGGPTKPQVVWVYGASAAGKQTFIQTLLARSGWPLVDRLGWRGLQLAPCRESLQYIGESDNDPVIARRRTILSSAVALTNSFDVILIKGQRVDFIAHLHEDLRHRLPEARYRLILLSVPLEELARRLVHKSWWDPRMDPITSAKDDLRFLDETLDQFDDCFELTVLDACTPKYEILRVDHTTPEGGSDPVGP